MSSITIELESDIASLLNDSGQSAPAAARELVVMELYRVGRLSTGRAAAALSMDRLTFLNHASDLGISSSYRRMTSNPI